MKKLTVRMFGSSKCQKCKKLKGELEISLKRSKFIYVDANADDTQAFCDEHNVDALPHVQIVDNKKVIIEISGEDIGFLQVAKELKTAYQKVDGEDIDLSC